MFLHRFFLFAIAALMAASVGCLPSSAPQHVEPETIGLDADSMADRSFVVLKFGADWCGPCRSVDRSLDQLTETHGASVIVQKIDIDQEPELSKTFGVRGIPRLFLLKDGKVVDNVVGSRSHKDLARWVESEGATAGPAPASRLRVNPNIPKPVKFMPVDLTPHLGNEKGSAPKIRRNPFTST